MSTPLALRLLVLASVVVAGCVGDPVSPAKVTPTPTPPTGEPEPLPEQEGPITNVTRMNGSIAGVGNPAVAHVRAGGENQMEFDLAPNATGLVIEVKWDSGAALDVVVRVPPEHCTPVDPAGLFLRCPSPPPDTEGQSPARIEVTDPEMLKRVGTWNVGAWARASASPVPFEIVVSIFEGGQVPQGYSAL